MPISIKLIKRFTTLSTKTSKLQLIFIMVHESLGLNHRSFEVTFWWLRKSTSKYCLIFYDDRKSVEELLGVCSTNGYIKYRSYGIYLEPLIVILEHAVRCNKNLVFFSMIFFNVKQLFSFLWPSHSFYFRFYNWWPCWFLIT